MKKNNFYIVLLYFLVLVFILSAIGKIIDSTAAEKALLLILGRPNTMVGALEKNIILFFSISELSLSLLLLSKWKKFALVGLTVLISVFLISLVSLPLRGIQIQECGCFGAIIPNGSLEITIFKNVILIFIFLYLIRTYVSKKI